MICVMLSNWKTRRRLSKDFNKTFKELNNLSDRDLDDIGVRRGQIRQIALDHVYGH